MKALMMIIAITGSIYAQDMDGRSEGVSPKVFVQDTKGWVSAPREVVMVAPPKKDVRFVIDGFDYHRGEEKPTDILMEGNMVGDVVDPSSSTIITFGE